MRINLTKNVTENNIDEKKIYQTGIVIDYNKLMNIYKELKND